MLPPAIWLTRKVARMRRAITAQQQRQLADMNAQVEEGLSISGVLLAKTLGAGPAQAERFAGTSARAGRAGGALAAGRPLADGAR